MKGRVMKWLINSLPLESTYFVTCNLLILTWKALGSRYFFFSSCSHKFKGHQAKNTNGSPLAVPSSLPSPSLFCTLKGLVCMWLDVIVTHPHSSSDHLPLSLNSHFTSIAQARQYPHRWSVNYWKDGQGRRLFRPQKHVHGHQSRGQRAGLRMQMGMPS